MYKYVCVSDLSRLSMKKCWMFTDLYRHILNNGCGWCYGGIQELVVEG